MERAPKQSKSGDEFCFCFAPGFRFGNHWPPRRDDDDGGGGVALLIDFIHAQNSVYGGLMATTGTTLWMGTTHDDGFVRLLYP